MSFSLGIGPFSIDGLGHESDPYKFRREDRQLFRNDRRHLERREDTRLQRLVKDGTAVGLHPLAAIGAQAVGPAATQFFSQPGYEGSGGSSDLRVGYKTESQLEKAQAELLQKQSDLIDEQILDSQIARLPKTPELITDVVNPQRTSHVDIGGGKLKSNPGYSDAQSYEDRYGEIVGALMGILNLPADAFQTWFRNRDPGKHGGGNVGHDLPPELRKKLFGK